MLFEVNPGCSGQEATVMDSSVAGKALLSVVVRSARGVLSVWPSAESPCKTSPR